MAVPLAGSAGIAHAAVESGADIHTAVRSAGLAPVTKTTPAADNIYVVKRGDTLSGIAAAHHVNGGWQALWKLNRKVVGANPDLIIPNQRLRLTASATKEAKSTATKKAKPTVKTAPQASQSGSDPKVVKTVSGLASYFGDSSEYQPMACGGNSRNITKGVALWKIPCGTKIRITSKETGKSVIAPVADRGPASWTGVAIDLLPDTWDALGVSRGQGKQKVTYEILGN